MTDVTRDVAVYADESCLGNGREGSNPGGAAGVIEFRGADGRVERRDYWVASPATTNNRMALTSLIEALRIVTAKDRRPRLLFTTDSRYIVDGMGDWIHGWKARGWRRKTGPIENLELWKEADALIQRVESPSWRWVRGHVGHPQNEYANDLAVRAAENQTSSNGAVASGFAAWLDERRARGVVREPDPFPDEAAFRAATLPRSAVARR
ncbi:MAG: ribonuclease HI [Gemmatimonadaceae bacterium]